MLLMKNVIVRRASEAKSLDVAFVAYLCVPSMFLHNLRPEYLWWIYPVGDLAKSPILFQREFLRTTPMEYNPYASKESRQSQIYH